MWIIVTASVLAMCTFVLYRTWRPGGRPDLGWVTERWLTEHRANYPGTSR